MSDTSSTQDPTARIAELVAKHFDARTPASLVRVLADLFAGKDSEVKRAADRASAHFKRGAEVMRERDALRAELADLRKRVLDLHRLAPVYALCECDSPDDIPGHDSVGLASGQIGCGSPTGYFCLACTPDDGDDPDYLQEWPCPTVQSLSNRPLDASPVQDLMQAWKAGQAADSDSKRQGVGDHDPGHCADCAFVEHVAAHPDLGGEQ